MSTQIEMAARILASLSNIENFISVAEFIQRELTGDATADALLTHLMLGLLGVLRSQGMIAADDDLRAPNARIYGLTQDGRDLYQLAQTLTAPTNPT